MFQQRTKIKKIFVISTTLCILFALLSATMIQPIQATTSKAMSDASLDIIQESDNVYTLCIDDITLTVEVIENGQRVSTTMPDGEMLTFETTTELKPVYNTSLRSSSETVEYVRVLVINGTEIMELPVNPSIPNQPIEDETNPSRGTVYYWWDGIYFEKDVPMQWIKYPHPYRNYAPYTISPFNDWCTQGNKLIHYQFSKANSNALKTGGSAVLGAAIGSILGAVIGGGVGAAVGALIGTVMCGLIGYFYDWQIVDECDCVWWWLNTSFANYVYNNATYLAALIWAQSPIAPILLTNEFHTNGGYLRVGTLTFADKTGIGNP